MDGIDKAHAEEYGAEPAVLVEVPQVTTLLGAFSEYCSGYAITSTNNHGLRVAITPRTDNLVRIFNASRGERKKFQLAVIRQRKEDKWAQIVKAVCQAVISAELPISGFDMTFKGQSAAADNPSLTAALVSGLICALNSLFGFALDADGQVRLAFSTNRFSEIYKLRLRDLITIFTASPGKIIFFDLESYEYESIDYPFVKGSGVGSYFIDCNLPEGELSEEVTLFRANCIDAAKRMKDILPRGEKLRLLTERGIRNLHLPLPEDLKRTISFVVEDSAFAKKSIDSIKSGNSTAFGKIFTAEQRNLSELAELTSPEVDWLVKRGIETQGVKGVTEISVGISGTLVALIEDGAEEQYRAQLEEYERIFGFHPIMREYVPSGSIKVIIGSGV